MIPGFKLAEDLAKKRNLEIPYQIFIPRSFIDQIGLPSIVKCKNCGLVMDFTASTVSNKGETYCSVCIQNLDGEDIDNQSAA